MTFPSRRRAIVPWTVTILVLVVVVGTLWTIGLVRFVRTIPEQVTDTATKTDAIIVLTGGSERLRTGLELLSEEKARHVFVSGVHESVDLRELLTLAGQEASLMAAFVEAGHGAKNTAENAIETADWMRGKGYHSMRLVTASYHMPRSLLEFHHAFPEADIVAHPVFPSAVKQRRWWAWPGTAALIISEYNKFLLAWLDHRVNTLFDIDGSGEG